MRRLLAAPLLAAAMLAQHGVVSAASVLSGDVNRDGLFDTTDIVTLVNTLNRPDFDTIFGEDLLILDANQDGLTDTDDAAWIAEIILGLEEPLALAGGSFTPEQVVSLWLLPEAEQATEADTVLIGAVSLWLPPPVPPAGETDTLQRGTPSFELE